MKGRVIYLAKTFLWTVVVFIMAKVAFMIINGGEHPFALTDIVEVIRHGLSLDLSTALYIIDIPFLCMAVSIWYPQERLFRRILRPYSLVISITFALAFVADTSLYGFWGFKLDASFLQYLETPTEAMASVSTGYILLRLLAIILLAAFFTKGYWQIPLRTPTVHMSASHSTYHHWHPWWNGRIDNEHRTGVLLAKPVPESFCREPLLQFSGIVGENCQRRARLHLYGGTRTRPTYEGSLFYRQHRA